MRDTAGSGGAVLLGYDQKKDPTLINTAYNDAEVITAAFTLNLLLIGVATTIPSAGVWRTEAPASSARGASG